MKKLLLVSFSVLLASLSFGQRTFTVTEVSISGQKSWDLNGLQLNCPQTTTGGYTGPVTSGTFIEGLQQVNLGNIDTIVFSVNSIDISKWQTTNNICNNVVILANANSPVTISGNNLNYIFSGQTVIKNIIFNSTNLQISGQNSLIDSCSINGSNSGSAPYRMLVIGGTNNTLSNSNMNNTSMELNGKHGKVLNNSFSSSQAIAAVCILNSNYNRIENNVMSRNNNSGNSAIRIGTNQAETIVGNSKCDTIIGNKISGYWNAIMAGQWKQTNPICDSLLIKNNECFNNLNAGIYIIYSKGTEISSNYSYSNANCGIIIDDLSFAKIFDNKVGLSKSGNIMGNINNGITVHGGNNLKIGDFVLGGNVIVKSGNGKQSPGVYDAQKKEFLAENNGIFFDTGYVSKSLPINSSIKANYVGIMPNGIGSVNTTGNQESGILFRPVITSTILNDTIGGQNTNDGNIIGFNGFLENATPRANGGIQLNKLNNTVLILNNYVGIFKDGSKIGNKWDGIALKGTLNCVVSNNKVGNNGQGISVRWQSWQGATQSTNNIIKSNYAGTSNGIDSQPNQEQGISIEWGSKNNTLGGSNPSDGNIVKHEVIGIWVAGDPDNTSNLSNQNIISNNIISNCTSYGISINNKTKNLLVKSNKLSKNGVGISFTGAADSPILQSNTIDSSTSNGVVIDAVVLNYKSQNNKIQRTTAGNGVYVNKAIKTAEFRTDTLSENSANGYLINAGTQSIIGGTAGEGNVIYKNGSAGIRLTEAAANEIQMRRNSISCNAVAGIKLEGGANNEFFNLSITDKILIDTSATTKDTIVGLVNINSPYADGIIEAFDKGPECRQSCIDEAGRQGYKYIGQAVTGVDGKFRLGLSSPIVDFKNITFTVTTKGATNTTGKFSTSEFSRCTNILPVNFLKVSATSVAQGVLVKWTTATETNNEYFVVQRSKDGINFETISGEIEGAGNAFTATNYSFVDTKPTEGVNYYRIKQVDFTGLYDFSKIVAVNLGSDKVILIAPNPSKGEFTIKVIGDDETAYRVNVFNALGQLIFDSSLDMFTGYAEKKFDISNYATGVYTVHLISENGSWTKKLIKE